MDSFWTQFSSAGVIFFFFPFFDTFLDGKIIENGDYFLYYLFFLLFFFLGFRFKSSHIMSTKMKGLLKGLRYISQIFGV